MRRGNIVVEEYRRAVGRNTDIKSKLASASLREEFVAIRDEIKLMPNGTEKSTLQQEYLKKYNEFSRKHNEQFDIRMEYKPSEELNKINNLEIRDILTDKVEPPKPKFNEAQQRAFDKQLENIKKTARESLNKDELTKVDELLEYWMLIS